MAYSPRLVFGVVLGELFLVEVCEIRIVMLALGVVGLTVRSHYPIHLERWFPELVRYSTNDAHDWRAGNLFEIKFVVARLCKIIRHASLLRWEQVCRRCPR